MKQIIKKLVSMVITLLLVSFLVFLAFSIIPGDPAISKLGTNATPEAVESLRQEMGLNQPFFVRYGSFIVSFLRGDMGMSYSYDISVSEMLAGKMPITITMVMMAFLLIIAISIPLGIYCAKHNNKAMDHFICSINQLIMAIPPFFSGILITYIFGIILRWFVPGGFVSYTKNVSEFLFYMIFPAIAIALPKVAMTTKLLRTSLIEEMKKDYVRTAYSKGNSTNAVLFHHVLKNAIIPVITFLGIVLTDMIAGSIIIEQVFNIPGIGRILLTSIGERDFPVVESIIMLIAVLVIVTNFIVDILYRILDPRIRGSK